MGFSKSPPKHTRCFPQLSSTVVWLILHQNQKKDTEVDEKMSLLYSKRRRTQTTRDRKNNSSEIIVIMFTSSSASSSSIGSSSFLLQNHLFGGGKNDDDVGRCFLKKTRGSRSTSSFARRQLRRNNNKSIAITECVTAKTALKEWSKTEKAIERGEQVLLFRKGGINDNNNGGFQILENQFVIFPTSFHSANNGGESDAMPDMKKGDSVPFSIVCRITRAWQTSDKSVIKALEKFHALREDEIVSRVNYKPNEPYSILEVRAYVLPKDEYALPADVEKYGGCKSWIEKLPFGIPDTTTLPPVLDQRDWLISQSDLKRKLEFLVATGVEIKELPI